MLYDTQHLLPAADPQLDELRAPADTFATGQTVRVIVEGIEHVQLAMPAGQEQAAVEFYEGLLGVTHVAKPPHLARRGGCWFETGRVKIHLGVEQDFRPARKAHPALLVDDVAGLVRVLRDAGVELVDDEPLDGYDRVYASDPFGNRLEFMQPLDRPA